MRFFTWHRCKPVKTATLIQTTTCVSERSANKLNKKVGESKCSCFCLWGSRLYSVTIYDEPQSNDTCPVMPVITATFLSFLGSPLNAELTLACSEHWAIADRLQVYSLLLHRPTEPTEPSVFTVGAAGRGSPQHPIQTTPLQSARRSRKRRRNQPIKWENVRRLTDVTRVPVCHSGLCRTEGEGKLHIIASVKI